MLNKLNYLMVAAIVFSAFLVLSSIARAGTVPPGAELVFSSGFDNSTTLDTYANAVQWWTDVFGQDRNTGFVWDTDMPVKSPPSIQYLIGRNKAYQNYVSTYFTNETTSSGRTNRALVLAVKADDPNFSDVTRNQLNIYWDDVQYNDVYVSYRMKFQGDLSKLMPAKQSTWRNFMEWRETGSSAEDFRIVLYVKRNEWTHPQRKDDFYFAVEAEQIRPDQNTYWNERNGAVKVQVGEWFNLGIRIKRHTSGGIFQMWVNGQPVFNLNGVRTKKDSAISKWNLFKVYTEQAALARGRAWQAFDDLKFYIIR